MPRNALNSTPYSLVFLSSFATTHLLRLSLHHPTPFSPCTLPYPLPLQADPKQRLAVSHLHHSLGSCESEPGKSSILHPPVTSSRRASRVRPQPPSSGQEASPSNNWRWLCGCIPRELRLIGTPIFARYEYLQQHHEAKTRQLGVCNPSPHTSSIILSC